MSAPTFFCGIGGSGMSAIAQVLAARGQAVRGSDRSRDQGKNAGVFDTLAKQGIELVPQDGSAVAGCERVVVSTAVEPSIPDVKAAMEHGVPIIKRAELLAELFNAQQGIAIGGTSGKSTVTGMLGHILASLDVDPVVINGGVMLNVSEESAGLGNARCGQGSAMVIEADESDGTIALYNPAVSVVTNVTVDHKPMDELRPLFEDFVKRATLGAVINAQCPEAMALKENSTAKAWVSFAINADADIPVTDIEPTPWGQRCKIAGVSVEMMVPGEHNAANAAAAVAACTLLGIDPERSVPTLASFKGIGRRLQVLGLAGGVTVIDDFGHNPEKIAASLATLRQYDGRLLIMYQPHGFGPTRFLRDGLAASFAEGLGPDDHVIWPEIYYAGGTATKDISSQDLVDDINAQGGQAHFATDRAAAGEWLLNQAKPGDRIVIMGARDDSLTEFGHSLLDALADRP